MPNARRQDRNALHKFHQRVGTVVGCTLHATFRAFTLGKEDASIWPRPECEEVSLADACGCLYG